MTISTSFDTSLERRFDSLSDVEKAAQWVSFLDAVDAGDMGWHPYYEVLAPMYATGVSPFDGETADEQMEPRELDIFSLAGVAYLEALELQPTA